jgi:hypothetical protein
MQTRPKRTRISPRKLGKLFPGRERHLRTFDAIQDVVYAVSFKPAPAIEREELRRRLGEGGTILDSCGRGLDAGAFAGALKRLFAFLARSAADAGGPDAGPAARRFSAAGRKPIPETLMDDYLLAAQAPLARRADKLGLSTAELVSCCQQAARPQLVSLREANSGAQEGVWALGHCPCCGALPCMAQVSTTGLRQLFCPNCYARYRFARHHCPGCGHAGLVALTMDAWPRLLLEKCPECNAYLKTWDLGAGEPPCPYPYLDIATGDVDEAAVLQGLKRLSLSVMGL